MRKFYDKKAFVIAFNILYVTSFFAMMAFTISKATEKPKSEITMEEYYSNPHLHGNYDEVD
tara:strand:+ start:367 stop:549 length:183 start_codon:yes stop_codon:yes gene_type:complete